MLGMSHNTFLLLDAVVTIIGLIVLILLAIGWPFISNLFQKKKVNLPHLIQLQKQKLLKKKKLLKKWVI